MNHPEQTENIYESDEYGFFCDLESQEEVEYYVITKKTHYEVRRKSAARPKINGSQRTHIIDLSSARSSTDDLEFISESSTLQGNPYSILTFAINFPKSMCNSLFMCCAAVSCVYFIITLPDVKKSPN